MQTIQNIAPASSRSAPQRSWFARHKFLTGLGLLLIVILVAGYIWGWPLVKWRYHRLFAESLAEIERSQAAIDRLGQPISVPLMPMPSGRVDDDGKRGDGHFFFTVVGTKDKADVASQLRMFDGKWGFTQLKLTFPDKTELDLTTALQQADGDSLPKFDPTAEQPNVKKPDLPVDIVLPDLPAIPQK